MATSFLSPAKAVPLLTYSEVTTALGKELVNIVHPDSYNPISGVSMDSRDLFFGEMFLSLDGDRFRGIDFLASAYVQGVRVFVVEEKYLTELNQVLPMEAYHQSCFFLVNDPVSAYQNLAGYYLSRMGILRIAVTGSAGKTSAKEILTQLLHDSFGVFCNYKNENNHFGVPKTVCALQRQLTGGDPIHIAVFELGMNHAGEIERVASLVKPQLVLITNILYSHIGNFSNREDIVAAKGEVIPFITGHEAFPEHPNGLLLIPDDIYGKDILKQKITACPYPPSVREVKPSLTVESRLVGENRRSIVSEWTDRITGKKIMVPGFSVFHETLSLVLEAAEMVGLSRRDVFCGLEQKPSRTFPLVESRFQIIDQEGKPLVIDDTYNANPHSMIMAVRAILHLFPQFPIETRLTVVLGDMLELGPFSLPLHKECGKSLGQAVMELPKKAQERVRFFFLGPEMKICYDNTNFSSKKYYEKYSSNQTEILRDLTINSDARSVLFFKASHGMQFHRLLKDFLTFWESEITDHVLSSDLSIL